MACYQLMGGFRIGMFMITLRQHVFFLRLKHWETTNFFKITGKATVTGCDAGEINLGHRAPSFIISGSHVANLSRGLPPALPSREPPYIGTILAKTRSLNS
ncbi:hypothetical protein FQZ97_1008660 [compost metagenome]